MERDVAWKEKREPRGRAGRALKWAFVITLALAAGIIGLLTILRTHPAQATVGKAFCMVEEGDVDGFMEFVDSEGDFGRSWYENERGVRDAALSLLRRYRLEFSSLKFSTRAKRNYAEVALKGGRVAVYDRAGEGPALFSYDLGGSGLVIYLENMNGRWLIRGMNYDIMDFLSEDVDLLHLR